MSKLNDIAYHGSSAKSDIIFNQGLSAPVQRMNDDNPIVQKFGGKETREKIAPNIISFLPGPVLREGVLDAHPYWSVSLSWEPNVACFFPPKHEVIYLYAVYTAGMDYKDVDAFAKKESKNRIDRSYMKEIAVRSVEKKRILGVFNIKRKNPPANIRSVVNHQMVASVSEPVDNNQEYEKFWGRAKTEVKMSVDGQTLTLKSLGATFHECPF